MDLELLKDSLRGKNKKVIWLPMDSPSVSFVVNSVTAMGFSPFVSRKFMKDTLQLCSCIVINNCFDQEVFSFVEERKRELGKDCASLNIVLDLVGACVCKDRRDILNQWLKSGMVNCVRGNKSEFISMIDDRDLCGVDCVSGDISLEKYQNPYDCPFWISGEVDLIVDTGAYIKDAKTVSGGDEMVTKVSGIGCVATAVMGCLTTVMDSYNAAYQGALVMKYVAKEACEKAKGPGSFPAYFLDALYRVFS